MKLSNSQIMTYTSALLQMIEKYPVGIDDQIVVFEVAVAGLRASRDVANDRQAHNKFMKGLDEDE